jgi:hypothetical protein
MISCNVQADNSETIKKCSDIIKMSAISKQIENSCGIGVGESEKIFTVYASNNCDKLIDLETSKLIGMGVIAEATLKEKKMGHEEYCKFVAANREGSQDEQPKQKESQQESESFKPVNQDKSWQGDWGNGIIAIVSSESCGDRTLISEGYNYLMSVSIPKARLKVPTDAWQVVGDRAITITGCWIKKPDNMIHAKLTKKKGNKTWEQDFKMDDGNWTAK